MAEKMNLNINTNAIKDVFINFLVPLVALGITAGLGFFVIYPSVKSLKPLQSEVDAKMVLSSQLHSKLANLNKILDFKPIVDENSDLVKKVLVDEPAVPLLLTQIDQIAKESGLRVTKLSYSFSEASEKIAANTTTKPANESPYKVVNVALGAEGNFDQLTTFLRNLERSARIVDVENFRYNAVEKESNLLSITFSLLSPYVKIESEAVTDDPVALDISDAGFINLINRIKEMKYYDITLEDINTELIEDTEETTPSAAEDEVADEVVDEVTTEIGNEVPEDVTDESPTNQSPEELFGPLE